MEPDPEAPEAGGDSARAADVDATDDDLEVVWDLTDFDDEDLDELDAALEEAGIDREWEDGVTLVVAASQADRAEGIIERLDFPMALQPEPDSPLGEEAGLLLGRLLEAARRLQREPSDLRGIEQIIEYAEVARTVPVPFGLSAEEWSAIVANAGELRDSAIAERPDVDLVRARAQDLHGLLQPLV